MSDEYRDFLRRLAMALIDGNMDMWESAAEQDRTAAKEYLQRAEILIPEYSVSERPIIRASKARRSRLPKKSTLNFDWAACD